MSAFDLNLSISKRAAVFMVVTVSIAVYANTLWNGFVWDDALEILENKLIRDAGNIPLMFTSNAWNVNEMALKSNYYRPMMHVFHMIEYYLFGLKPWGYHFFNIVLNGVASAAVFLILNEALKRPPAKEDAPVTVFALSGALIFALHPVHTEIVAWASAMAELEASSFGLFGLYLYMRAGGAMGLKYAASVLLLLLALLTKETGIAYFALIAAYDYCMSGRFELRRYAAYGAALGVYFLLRFNALGYFVPVAEKHGEFTGYEAFINAFPLFAAYIGTLAWPSDLNAFHVMHPIRSPLEWRGMAAIVFAVIYLSALVAFRGVWRFSLAWMALPLLPVLNLKLMDGNVFAERYFYSSSVGFALIAAVMLKEAYARRVLGSITAAALAIDVLLVCATYAVSLVYRNAVWRNDLTLWTDTVKKSPDGIVPRINLGSELIAHGRPEQAARELEVAVKLGPEHVGAYYNLGMAYLMLNRKADAEWKFAIAMELSHRTKYKPAVGGK